MFHVEHFAEIQKDCASVAQWIEQTRPKGEMGVRFPLGARLRNAKPVTRNVKYECLITLEYTNGPLAHLVERFHGMEEVKGSIPLWSTMDQR